MLGHSSHLRLCTNCLDFPWVSVNPDPASPFREVSATLLYPASPFREVSAALLCPASPFQEVSAALLYSNDLYCVSFHVQYIVLCIPDADNSSACYVFPCEYSYFLLSIYATLLDSLRYCKLHQLTPLMLNDLCCLVFVILSNYTFVLDILGCVSSFLSVSTNALLSSLQQSTVAHKTVPMFCCFG